MKKNLWAKCPVDFTHITFEEESVLCNGKESSESGAYKINFPLFIY